MNKILGLILLVSLFACDTNSSNRNPYLQEFGFRFDINTNLPLYSSLTNEGSAIYISGEQAGTRGIFVIKTLSAFSGYRAFEASCPNHTPNNCSTMTLDSSKNSVTCACEDYQYTLFTGQLLNAPAGGAKYYSMLEYSVAASGNIVSVTN
tara:strand:- start:453 stop:902 length:450 start_codon:yes stop_codon:yes gene_type:complete